VDFSQLRPSLRDIDPAVRTQAVTAAGALGGESAVPDLIAALSDASDWVRNAAAEALVDLKRASGRDLLRKVAAEDEDMYTRHWAEELLDRIEELERTGELIA
jgi:HEAT repeat protein